MEIDTRSTLLPDDDWLAPTEALEEIGRGEVARVFLAATRGTGVTRLSVLKCIAPGLASDRQFSARFLRRARLWARIDHPNVAQIYDVSAEGDGLSITMEYLHGQTLAAILKRLGGPRGLSLSQRLQIVIDILGALDCAHDLTDYGGSPLRARHGGVTPRRVRITYDGQVKLLDFSVRRFTPGASLRQRTESFGEDRAYLAPEEVLGRRADRRADVYSVGVILREMLEGSRLQPAGSEPRIPGPSASGDRRPKMRMTRRLPPGLEEICRRALAHDPAERFQTAAAMEAELQRVLRATVEPQPRPLGKMVATAFAGEKASREVLIRRHVGGVAGREAMSRSAGSGRPSQPGPASGQAWRRSYDDDDAPTWIRLDLLDLIPPVMPMPPLPEVPSSSVAPSSLPRMVGPAVAPSVVESDRRSRSRLRAGTTAFWMGAVFTGLLVVGSVFGVLRRHDTFIVRSDASEARARQSRIGVATATVAARAPAPIRAAASGLGAMPRTTVNVAPPAPVSPEPSPTPLIIPMVTPGSLLPEAIKVSPTKASKPKAVHIAAKPKRDESERPERPSRRRHPTDPSDGQVGELLGLSETSVATPAHQDRPQFAEDRGSPIRGDAEAQGPTPRRRLRAIITDNPYGP
jgi:serine/threonine protein kinase